MAILKYKDKNGNFVVLPTGGGSGSYELPIASAETLGGIKIGENLSITEDGTLNAEASGTSVLSPGAVLYDTEEKVIGKWINGKPLYQKVIKVDIRDRDWHNIQLNDSIDFVVKLKGILYYGDGYPYFIELQGNTYPNTDERAMLLYKKDENYIRYGVLYTQTDLTSTYLYIIIQYTKITDEPNSFRPDIIENISIMRNLDFSNIYTEEERIIGCWVDGRPIYQKYIDIGDISGSELNNYDVSSLNINFLVYVDVNYYQTNINNVEFWYSASSGADSRVLGINSDHTKLLCWGTNSVFRYTKLILRYTKTTDAENSFTADMLTDYENITDAEIEAAAAADKI